MRSLWFHDLHGQFGGPTLADVGARSPTDLVLIEGYKREVHTKIGVRVGQAYL